MCALEPRLAVRTRLLVVRHAHEAFKPTSTGDLVARCIPATRVVDWAHRGQAVELGLDAHTVLLFPPTSARPVAPLEELRAGLHAPQLVILDGTWRQASKMARHVPGLAALPVLTFPPVADDLPPLRGERREGGMPTALAVVAALQALEASPAAAEALLAAYRELVRRTLRSRGALRAWG